MDYVWRGLPRNRKSNHPSSASQLSFAYHCGHPLQQPTLQPCPPTHPGQSLPAGAADAAEDVQGTVMVRDVVTRQLVAHFRAHASPLSLLQFDPTGKLLVTASSHGHNINVFRCAPWLSLRCSASGGSRIQVQPAQAVWSMLPGVLLVGAQGFCLILPLLLLTT